MKSSTGWCSDDGEVGVEAQLQLLLHGDQRLTPVGQQVGVEDERPLAAAAGPLGEQRGVHPAGDVGRLLGQAELFGLGGEVRDVARADDLGRVAQRGEPAQVDVELGGHLLPDLGEPERVRVLDDDLLRLQLAGQPLVQLGGGDAGLDVVADEVHRRRAAVDVEERELLEVPLVEVDDPLRLVEPARVGLRRLDLGLRHVQAEALQGAGQRAGAAATGAGDQDQRGAGCGDVGMRVTLSAGSRPPRIVPTGS